MYEVIIVGGGQAGLAAAYYLKRHGINFLILDSNANVGDPWRNRYDSLQLFTPRMYDQLPGFRLEGDPHGLPHKDEIADYLQQYAIQYEFPIAHNTRVLSLQRREGHFKLSETNGEYMANKVIVATGPFQTPFVPPIQEAVGKNVKQLHSSEYRNERQLNEGAVLVVGAGNSGAQIACELAERREVHLSASGAIHYKPLHLLGKSIFWYYNAARLLTASRTSARGRWLFRQPEQIYGNTLKPLIGQGRIKLHGRTVSMEGDQAYFAGEDSPVRIGNIVWSTGFRRDDAWIDIKGAFRADGALAHEEGASAVPGLYFLGLPWQTSRGSALLGWVKYDAERIVRHALGK